MEPTHKRNEIANAFVGTFAFSPTLYLTQKKQKSLQATAPKTADYGQTNHDPKKNNEGITRVWQKWRFSASYDNFLYN